MKLYNDNICGNVDCCSSFVIYSSCVTCIEVNQIPGALKNGNYYMMFKINMAFTKAHLGLFEGWLRFSQKRANFCAWKQQYETIKI